MTTEERFEQLEAKLKRCNRLLLAGGALIVALSVLVCVGVAQKLTNSKPTAKVQGMNSFVPDVVRAREFVVVDENGETRAMLDADKNGPALSMFDTQGKPRAILNVDKDGPGLVMADANGKTSTSLNVTKDGPDLASRRCEWQGIRLDARV